MVLNMTPVERILEVLFRQSLTEHKIALPARRIAELAETEELPTRHYLYLLHSQGTLERIVLRSGLRLYRLPKQ